METTQLCIQYLGPGPTSWEVCDTAENAVLAAARSCRWSCRRVIKGGNVEETQQCELGSTLRWEQSSRTYWPADLVLVADFVSEVSHTHWSPVATLAKASAKLPTCEVLLVRHQHGFDEVARFRAGETLVHEWIEGAVNRPWAPNQLKQGCVPTEAAA